MMADLTPPLQEKRSFILSLGSWALYDFANSAYSAIVVTFILPAYFVKSVAADEAYGTELWGLVVGLLGVAIALGGPILGALVDKAGQLKAWMFLFTFINVFACAGLGFIKPHAGQVKLTLALFVLATLGSELAYVFYNTMLPHISPKDQIGRWSGWGWGLGYLGGMLSLGLALLLTQPAVAFFLGGSSQAAGVRATFILCALWQAFFAWPVFIFTPRTPAKMPLREAVVQAGKQLNHSLRSILHDNFLFRFFLARMFFIDGLLTIFAFGGIYAASKFNMPVQTIVFFGVTLNISAGVGAACFAFLDDRYGPKNLMVLSLVALIIFSAWVLLAQTEGQFWMTSLLLGIFVGPVQAASRSYLAKIAPVKAMTEMFGFFTLSGKATSFLGPFLLSLIFWLTGSLTLALSTVILFFTVGLVLLFSLPSVKKIC